MHIPRIPLIREIGKDGSEKGRKDGRAFSRPSENSKHANSNVTLVLKYWHMTPKQQINHLQTGERNNQQQNNLGSVTVRTHDENKEILIYAKCDDFED